MKPEEGMKRRFGPATAVADERTPLARALDLMEHAASNGGMIVLETAECRAVIEALRPKGS